MRNTVTHDNQWHRAVNNAVPRKDRGNNIVMHLKEKGTIDETRMLHADQAQRYTGMGRTAFRKWADSIGATRKFGSSVRFDKNVIDKALDNLTAEGDS